MGNHDAYYTHYNDITALSVLKEYENIKVIETPIMYETDDGVKYSLIPWIANEKDEEYLEKFIKKNPHSITFGHFEFKNFEVIPGHKMDGGMDSSIFKNFDSVYSGHYHNKQTQGNIHYLGTPYELTWNDYQSEKGFYIWDTKTLHMEFIKNENVLYKKIYYDEDFVHSALIECKDTKDKIIKVYVVTKTKEPPFSNFLYELEQAGPESFSIIENDDGNEELAVGNDNKKIIDIIEDYLTDLEREDHEQLMKVFNYIYKKVLEDE